MKENILADKSKRFALKIIKLLDISTTRIANIYFHDNYYEVEQVLAQI